jgi:hypothetical protein
VVTSPPMMVEIWQRSTCTSQRESRRIRSQ